jgi:glycosyltransferase involved in cell wall biosynthesis
MDLTILGHPYSPLGIGENVRCTYNALKKIGIKFGTKDIYGYQHPEGLIQTEIHNQKVSKPSKIHIFHLNGDEVEPAFSHLGNNWFKDSYNIVFPNWELENYPKDWGEKLSLFDEIWAPTFFIYKSLLSVVTKPLKVVTLSSEVNLSSFLNRKYFGIPYNTYIFLFFFDFRSYIERKNPEAVLESFEKLLTSKKNPKTKLVLKLNGAEGFDDKLTELKKKLAVFNDKIILINKTISDNEVKNLIRCCDSFVSLHRSEGFGRGLAEAMYLGKPVIATGYSGNLDFMGNDNSLLVDYKLIPLKNGEYPYWENQHWADANTDHAASFMSDLIDNPKWGLQLGHKARISTIKNIGFRSAGLKYLNNIKKLIL